MAGEEPVNKIIVQSNNSQPAIVEIYFRGFDNSTGIDITCPQKRPAEKSLVHVGYSDALGIHNAAKAFDLI